MAISSITTTAKRTGALLLLSSIATNAALDCAAPLTCEYTGTPPTLDGDLSEWESVGGGIETDLYDAITGSKYATPDSISTKPSYKCMYNETHVFFAMDIPGLYRFNATDDHHCAAISTMFKVGEEATFYNMGGCPMALMGCDAGVPGECDPFRVDIGAHFELSGTEQGVEYGTSGDAGGNDLVANKDDEYGVSPECRFDDNDANAFNDWAGAWAFVTPGASLNTTESVDAVQKQVSSVEGDAGSYTFELSRPLTTASPKEDAQFTIGGTYSIGFAYWDPNEDPVTGWSKAGHLVTGCGAKWIDMTIGEAGTSSNTQSAQSSGSAVDGGLKMWYIASGVLAFVATLLGMA